jgi:hypothetical protein
MDCVVRVRSSQNPNIVGEASIGSHFVWPQIKNALLSELGIEPSEDIYFVLLDNDGKVAGPIIADDKRFWTLYNNKYVADSNMVFELNFRHHTRPEPPTAAAVPRFQFDANHTVSSTSHTKDIHAITIEGNLSAIKALVAEGVQVSSRDDTSSTPLHYACAHGHVSIVQYLLSEKPLIKNYRDSRGRTPLLRAASGGHLDVVQYLIAEKAFTFVVDEDGNSTLHLAAMNGHEDVVNWLIESESADTELTNKAGLTYTQAAAQHRPSASSRQSVNISCSGSQHPLPTSASTSQASAYSSAPSPAANQRGTSSGQAIAADEGENSHQSMMWCRLHGHVDSLYLPVSLATCTWDQLCKEVVSSFSVVPDHILSAAEEVQPTVSPSAALITHVVLIEEDGDEGSGKIDDMRKFAKLYKKLYRPESGMLFEFHIDNNQLLRLLSSSESNERSYDTGGLDGSARCTHGEEELETAARIREAAAEVGGSMLDAAQHAIREIVTNHDDMVGKVY